MSSHHDHSPQEPKKVAFGTPLILGLITVLVIVLLVSLGDKKHGCCEGETNCEQHDKAHSASSSESHDSENHSTEHNKN